MRRLKAQDKDGNYVEFVENADLVPILVNAISGINNSEKFVNILEIFRELGESHIHSIEGLRNYLKNKGFEITVKEK